MDTTSSQPLDTDETLMGDESIPAERLAVQRLEPGALIDRYVL